ncbi:TonB-dependent receptor [Flavobacteriaceae bacterium GSB9]|nr:TonB-dependent receptor [Flavobacteriaceae bacterium GSB9]
MCFKQIYLYIVFFICPLWVSFGQTIITGKVIDADTKIAIPNTLIINLKTKDSVISNQYGYFEINNTGSRFIFKKHGYLDKAIKITGNKVTLIALQITPSRLNEIVITSKTPHNIYRNTPATVNIITNAAIERSNTTNFNGTLNRVPGVFMQTGALNTNRITVRGIGSRNLYGTAKIRAYFKDIPLTNGSGETNIEDFELASISKMEIIKSAIATTYGAGLGGTITLFPTEASLNHTKINSGLTIGSFDLLKNTTKAHFGFKKNSMALVHSNTKSNGYRENNQYRRQTLTLNSNHFINLKSNLSLLASYVDLKAFIPSSINKTTYLNSPKSADTNWKDSKGHEDSNRGIFGASWNYSINHKTDVVSSIFTSFKKSYEPRPFNILEEKTLAYGLRSRLSGHTKIFSNTLNYTFGGELFKDVYRYKTYENLYKDYPQGTGSVAGNQISNFKEKRRYYNIFAETDYDILEKTTLSVGLNINNTNYTLYDQFPTSSTNPDQSGEHHFKTLFSPKFGISHLISKTATIYANISHGFSPITLNETLLPNGQINKKIKPETGWNFEVGSRGATLKNRLAYSISFYRLNIKNLLVSRRTAEDQFIGVNAGKTQHDGLESSLNYLINKNKKTVFNIFLNHSLNHYTFKEFIEEDQNYSGNDLTGVPSQVFNSGIDINSSYGFYGYINFQHVGKMPITDSNSLYSESYNLTNLKFGFKTNLNKNLKLNGFFGLNNIFDTHYASQILVNATSFGGAAPRYYYPGNPTNYYAGINVNYLF